MAKQKSSTGQAKTNKIQDAAAGTGIWDKLLRPSKNIDEASLPRLLNAILLTLIGVGAIAVAEYAIRHSARSIIIPVTSLFLLFIAYLFNRRAWFNTAVLISLTTLTLSIFTTLWMFRSTSNDFNILFYLVVPVIFAQFFLPLRSYLIAATLILVGLFLLQPYDPVVKDITAFMTMFCGMLGAAGYYRQKLELTQRKKLLASERQHADQIELLNRITQTTLQTSNTQEILQILADQLGQIMLADGAFITLWKDESEQVIPAAAYGEFRDVYRSMKLQPGENTLTAAALREQRAIPIEDVFNTPYLNPVLASRFPSRSMLVLPLIANNIKLGAALISFNEHHEFTAEEISIGEQVARQIALAVFKAQLYDNEARRATQLELLEEVGRMIAGSFNESEIIQRALEAVVNKFGYAEATISLLSNDGFLEITAITGTEDYGYRPGYKQEIGKGVMGHVAQSRKSYVATDVSQDHYYYSTASREGSALGVPMMDKQQLLGVLYVESKKPADFSSEDVKTLETLATQVATSLQKARLHAATQEHLNITTTLQSVSQVVTSSLELKEIIHNVIELLQITFGYTYISVYLLNDDTLHLGAQLGYPDQSIFREIPIDTGIIGRTVRTKTTQFLQDANSDPTFLRASYEVKSEICVPLLKKNNVLGVLNVESKEDHPLEEHDLNLLTAIAGPLSIAIDNARLHAEVKKMALTDPLSGLANRRAFDEILQTEFERAIRYHDQLSLIICDLDSFKEFNDQYGHPAGDHRIRELGRMLSENVRDPDVAARHGGEEFAIILPSTSKQGAIRLAERLRSAAESSAPCKYPDQNPVIPGYTISFGVASLPDDATTLNELLLAADNAELEAKRLGKNRVCAASTTDKLNI